MGVGGSGGGVSIDQGPSWPRLSSWVAQGLINTPPDWLGLIYQFPVALLGPQEGVNAL
jgi:hypothetical protein